jgi:hypothetical protein
MCLEADRRVCMLDRAGGYSKELFRFSTTKLQWEQLDPSQGSSPSADYIFAQDMVAVGNDLYVYLHPGDTRCCTASHRLGACQIERLGDAPRAAAVLVATPCARAGVPCRAAPGLVTRNGTSPLSWLRAVFGDSNELHRFSTKELRWEQLDATRVSDFPLSSRGLVSVGSQLYVYREYTAAGGYSTSECSTMGDGACLYSLFRFSTTTQQWKQLDEDISGFPPGKAIDFHDIVAVDSDHDSDLYVFGNNTDMNWDTGEEGPLLC